MLRRWVRRRRIKWMIVSLFEQRYYRLSDEMLWRIMCKDRTCFNTKFFKGMEDMLYKLYSLTIHWAEQMNSLLATPTINYTSWIINCMGQNPPCDANLRLVWKSRVFMKTKCMTLTNERHTTLLWTSHIHCTCCPFLKLDFNINLPTKFHSPLFILY
jgi:hypothetical protein